MRTKLFWGSLLLVAGLVGYASAGGGPSVSGSRISLDWGYIEYGPNGYNIVSTVEDPPEIRLGASFGGSLGKVSFDYIRPDGVHEEVVELQGKLDERTRNDPKALGGEATLHIRRPYQNGDAAMNLIVTLRSDGVAFNVPVTGLPVPNASTASDHLSAPDDSYRAYMQGDGNLVVYGTSDWLAVWASKFGVLATD